MAKLRKKSKPLVVKDAAGDTVAEIGKEVARYRMVPVDQMTHKRLMHLCELRGMGQRGQGAMVRILINKEFETLLPEMKNK
jgi:hypothetical protein